MRFLVMSRLIDAPVVPPQQELALLRAGFEHIASGADPRIKAVHPFADQRATAFVIEVETGEELERLLSSLPPSRLCTFQAHPLTTPETILQTLSEWEQALAGQ